MHGAMNTLKVKKRQVVRSSNESDGSDSEHAQSPAKRSCYTRSGRNATSFAFHQSVSNPAHMSKQ